MNKFIYVQDDTAKKELLRLGFHLLYENADTKLSIFENKQNTNFSKLNFKYVFSDTMII